MEIVLSIAAIIISVVSGIFSLYAFIWTTRRDRKQATLDAFHTLQDEVFDKLNLIKPSEIKEIAKQPTSEKYKLLSGYIARLEHFCVGINTGIYDKNIVYQLAHGYLDSNTILNRIRPIIDKKNRSGERDYYENIHTVLQWMKKRGDRDKRICSQRQASTHRKE